MIEVLVFVAVIMYFFGFLSGHWVGRMRANHHLREENSRLREQMRTLEEHDIEHGGGLNVVVALLVFIVVVVIIWPLVAP
jgi:hypothetical protein